MWVVVDANDGIFGCRNEPFIAIYDEKYNLYDWTRKDEWLGCYGGSKWWTSTKRKVS